jgi:hypothetical protein
MKLSEAILLGSSMLAPRAGGQHFAETQQGCALGMAAVARGCTFHPVNGPVDVTERRTLGVEGVWGDWVLEQVERPCGCWRIWMRRKMRIKDIIAHLFDHHIMEKKNWTLEQLVTWVETVEPTEVKPAFSPSLSVQQRETRFLEFLRLRQQAKGWQREADEWQAVRAAFEARHASGRKRNLTCGKTGTDGAFTGFSC